MGKGLSISSSLKKRILKVTKYGFVKVAVGYSNHRFSHKTGKNRRRSVNTRSLSNHDSKKFLSSIRSIKKKALKLIG